MRKFKNIFEKVTIKKDNGRSTGGAGVLYSIEDFSVFIPEDEDNGVNINLDGDEYAVDYDEFKELVSKIRF